MSNSQVLIPTGPEFVKFHDGAGKAFVFLVTKEDEGEHFSGAVWCDDEDNAAGLAEGQWNSRVQVGRGGPDKGVSWSPFE
jgi:hypothetical protein